MRCPATFVADGATFLGLGVFPSPFFCAGFPARCGASGSPPSGFSELVRPRLSASRYRPKLPGRSLPCAVLESGFVHRDPMAARGAQALDRNLSFEGKEHALGRDVNRRQSGASISRVINAID